MQTPNDGYRRLGNRVPFPSSLPAIKELLRPAEKSFPKEALQQQINSSASPVDHNISHSPMHVIPTHNHFRWIMLCLFLKVATESISFSILPYFVYYDLIASPSALGWSISGFTIAQLLATLLYGRLSDSFGRRWLLLCSFILNGIAFYWMSQSNCFVSFFFSRLLVGFSAVSIALVHAMVVDITHRGNRGIANSQIRSLLSLGFILGPACGGLIYSIFNDRRRCLLLCSVGAVSVFLLGYVFLPETLSKEMRRPLIKMTDLKIIEKFRFSSCFFVNTTQKSNDHSTKTSPWSPLSNWKFTFVCLVRFFFSAAGASMGGTYNLLIADTYKLAKPDFTMGKIFFISGLCMLLYQIYFYPLIAARFDSYVILLFACTLQALGIYFTWLSVSFPLWVHMIVQCCLYFAAYSLADPTITTLASFYTSKTNQGTAHGILMNCHVLANVMSPIIFGYLYTVTSYLPFFTAACIAIIPVILLLSLPRPENFVQ